MQDWAICGLGTFPRLAPHTGFLHALTSAFKKGDLVKEPSYIVTSSVFSIPASIYLERSEEKFRQIEEMEINLRKRQFVSYHPGIKRNVALDFTVILGLLGSAYEAGKIRCTHPLLSAILMTASVAGAYKTSEKAIRDIFNTPSFLVYDNLDKLLSETLDFDAIFNSSIKIEIPAVNINKAGWTLPEILADPPLHIKGWKNQGWVSVTNFKPEDVNLDKETRNANYRRKMINGMRIEAHFSPGKHDNDDAIFDTATMSNMPVHFAISQGYTNIVVLHYNSKSEGPTDRVYKKWPESTTRCGDTRVSENVRKTTLQYLRVNNDLDQLEKQKRAMDEWAAFLSYYPSGTFPRLEAALESGREAAKSYSFAHKKKINLLFVGSDPIPDAHFSDFDSEQMRLGINI
ncbi:MAG: hypothetical protein HYT62_01235, partial [Candidatus Yanofskybacteria bacterium]|nr:hypothetical protein [Candidatus Yanofskybacteria bacterium]